MSRPAVFLDTSAFYALADRRDAGHRVIQQRWQALLRRRTPFVTTVLVVAETATLIRRWLGFEAAQRWLEQLERARLTQAMEVVFIGEREYGRAQEFFQTLPQPRLSFVDACSFGVMALQGLHDVLSLDEDFRQAGFHLYE